MSHIGDRDSHAVLTENDVGARRMTTEKGLEMIDADPTKKNCYWHGCNNLSPFTCKGTVLCKDFGCKKNFCLEHKGEASIFIFEKKNFWEDNVFRERDAICFDHIEDANRRARLAYGIPALVFTVLSVVCLIVSITGIIGAINDVDWDKKVQEY